MTTTIESIATVLFDDKSAVEAFIKKGWLEKAANGEKAEEFYCRYTAKGEEHRRIISRFEAENL